MKPTKQSIQKEADRYKTRHEFKTHSLGAYNAARKLGILDEVCSHMPKRVDMTGIKRISLTDSQIEEVALKYSSRRDFENKNNAAYQAATKRGLLDKVCKHMEYKYTYRTDEEVHLEALKYEKRIDFQKGNPSAYSVAYKRNIVDYVCSHMEYLAYPWKDEELKEEGLKHDTKAAFLKANPNAHDAAWKRGILDEVCSHMKPAYNYKSDDELRIIANNYDKLVDFMKKDYNSFQAIYRRGLLKELCGHMARSSGSSFPEREILSFVRNIYPSAGKYKELKVRIPSKPHVHRLEIDIYVPELKKGIEFDGIFWHSDKRLIKSRPKWPIEDAINCHSIKDDYFALQGILILHIKEEDWIKDPEQSLIKVLDFLRR